MTESITQLARELRGRKPRRPRGPLLRRLALIVLAAMSPLLARLGWFWYLSEPSRQIELGRETTYIDGPLTPEGYVDYVAVVNAQLSEGVTAENNSVVLLAQAVGPGKIPDGIEQEFFERLGIPAPPADGHYLLDEEAFIKRRHPGPKRNWEAEQELEQQRNTARRFPWTRDEFPDLAELLDVNAGPLEVCVEASRRERYYAPMVADDSLARMIGVLLPIEQEQRNAARQLAARAMLKLGEGDLAGAWEDQQAIRRQSRLTGETPFLIGQLVAISDEEMAFAGGQAVIDSPDLTVDQARACLRDLQALKPWRTTADIIDTFERMTMLDTITGVARSPGDQPGFGPPGKRPPLANGAIDWNVPLRLMNAEFDALAAALRQPEPIQRVFFADLHRRLERQPISQVFLLMQATVGQRAAASERMGRTLVSLFMPAADRARNGEWRGLARERVLQTGFALAVYRREHGALPESLAALVPDLLSAVPLDPWTGEELMYDVTEEGAVVYSVDLDRQDDGGVPVDVEAGLTQGDVVIRVGAEPVQASAEPIE